LIDQKLHQGISVVNSDVLTDTKDIGLTKQQQSNQCALMG